MLVPRLGALILLAGFGFVLAQLAELVYVVAVQGYSSWLLLLAFLAPTGLVAVASALLVLRRHPLGGRLAPVLLVLVAATAVVALAGAPPVGRFLDDYEAAALERGVVVPPFERQEGLSPRGYVEQKASDVRAQGSIGAIAAAGVYVVLVRFSLRRRDRPRKPSPA
jgi:cytochrome c oxidase subunit IV